MSFVKETGSWAADKVPDDVATQAVTANPQTIKEITVRWIKFPPFGGTRI